MLLVGVWVFVVRSYTKNLNMEYVCPKNCWDPMIALEWIDLWQCCWMCDGLVMDTKSRKENPQKPTQLSSRSHPRHLVGKRTAQKTPS